MLIERMAGACLPLTGVQQKIIFSLRGDKWQQGHMAGTLKCSRNHALVLWTRTCALTRHDFSVGRHKAAQSLTVFIVYGANFVGTKVADFFNLGLIVPLVITIVVRHMWLINSYRAVGFNPRRGNTGV
jgi:hypothetical protein